LDTLPLFIAVTIYLFFWPGRFINEDRLKKERDEERTRKNNRGTASRGDIENGNDGSSAEVDEKTTLEITLDEAEKNGV
jgi:hypothetical protein